MAGRRTFRPDFKARVVLEDLIGVKSAAEICREHQFKPQLLTHWKAEFAQRAPEILAANPGGEDKERIVELECMVGRLTMELEVAKESRRSRVSDSILTSLRNRNGR